MPCTIQSEYDEMLADLNGFTLKKLWPRIGTTLKPLSRLSQMGKSMSLLPLSNAYSLPGSIESMILQLGLNDFLGKMHALSLEAARNSQLLA